MIGIKSGTKTWSTAEQQSSLKSDGRQTISAADKEAALGDQNIGDYLNKIADPNWVDPSKVRKVGNNELDKDAFLKLFLAQLKNQDPTNPMESHELAAQLAQFTSLEKLNNIDEGISEISKQGDPNKSYDALNLIGRGVSGDSSKVSRSDTTSQHEISFNLGAPATKVELSVRNAAGQEIKKLLAGNLKSGANKINWDGQIENGTGAPVGDYNVVITATNSAGQKVAAESKFEGRVSGVNFTPEGPVLMVGKQSIKLKDVKRIFDPREIKNEAQLVQSQAVAGKDAASAMASANPAAMGGNLESVGMSQDFINKLEKDAMKMAESAANGDGAKSANAKSDGQAGSINK